MASTGTCRFCKNQSAGVMYSEVEIPHWNDITEIIQRLVNSSDWQKSNYDFNEEQKIYSEEFYRIKSKIEDKKWLEKMFRKNLDKVQEGWHFDDMGILYGIGNNEILPNNPRQLDPPERWSIRIQDWIPVFASLICDSCFAHKERNTFFIRDKSFPYWEMYSDSNYRGKLFDNNNKKSSLEGRQYWNQKWQGFRTNLLSKIERKYLDDTSIFKTRLDLIDLNCRFISHRESIIKKKTKSLHKLETKIDYAISQREEELRKKREAKKQAKIDKLEAELKKLKNNK